MTADSQLIFESYRTRVLVNEWSPFAQGSKLDWAYEAIKFFEPTGILSIPDLIEASANLYNNRTTWNGILFLLSIVAVVPVAKYAGKALGKSAKVAAAAAAKGEDVSKLLPAITKEADELGEMVFKKLPEIEKFLVSKIKDKRTVGQIKGAISILRNNAVRAPLDAGGLAKISETLAAKTIEKKPGILSKMGSVVKGPYEKFLRSKTGKAAVMGSRLGAIDPVSKAAASITGRPQSDTPSRLADTSNALPPQAEPEWAQNLTPQQQAEIDQQTGGELPQASSDVATSAGIVPQNIFQALGGFGDRVSTSGERYGVVSPSNYGQGATEQNPAGRETMSPSEYTMPDTFNANPATLFQNFFNAILSSQAGKMAQTGAPAQPAQRPATGAFSRYNQLTHANTQQQAPATQPQQQMVGAPAYQTPYGAFPNDKFASAVNLLSQIIPMMGR